MVVRSGVELDKLLDTIEISGFLGTCGAAELEEFQRWYPNYTMSQNPRECEGVLQADGSVGPKNNVFGFWLPHGLSTAPNEFASQLRQCENQFNRIEEAFREVEGIPSQKLWLEREQARFFEQYPEQLPGANNDIPDIRETWEDSTRAA